MIRTSPGTLAALGIPRARTADLAADTAPPALPPGARRVVSLTMQPHRMVDPRGQHLARPESPVGRANARGGIRATDGFAPRPAERPPVSREVLAADLHAAMAHFAAAAPEVIAAGPALVAFLAQALVDTGWVTA